MHNSVIPIDVRGVVPPTVPGRDMANDFFISYRRTNKPLAAKLVDALDRQGSTVWWDEKIPPGRAWRDEIVSNMDDSNVVVILFSGACNESENLKKELAVAETLRKAIVPVLIEDTKPKGHFLYELAYLQWIQIHPEPEGKVDKLALELVSAFCAPPGDPSDSVDVAEEWSANIPQSSESGSVAGSGLRFYSSALPLLVLVAIAALMSPGFREQLAHLMRPVGENAYGGNTGLFAAAGAAALVLAGGAYLLVRRILRIRKLEARFRDNLKPL